MNLEKENKKKIPMNQKKGLAKRNRHDGGLLFVAYYYRSHSTAYK